VRADPSSFTFGCVDVEGGTGWFSGGLDPVVDAIRRGLPEVEPGTLWGDLPTATAPRTLVRQHLGDG
jgi:hypothetical protein